MTAYVNRIGTAVPPHDIHETFLGFARGQLGAERERALFDRMADRAGIAHRFSFFKPASPDAAHLDAEGFFPRGAFPTTAARMRRYAEWAPELALRAATALGLGSERDRITHLIVASCTGFSAPGLDMQLATLLGLPPDVRRSVIGFMGCSAAVPALRAAQDAVLADPAARVLVITLELCSLHLQETANLAAMLSFLLFGDGCAAALVTAEPKGLALDDFRSAVIPDSADLITWRIGDHGFTMHLSGRVPARIAQALRDDAGHLLRTEGASAIELWAVHAGGRSVLDAVECGLSLPPAALAASRAVLHDFGNMSSATVMFVLAGMLDGPPGRGLALAFGPGMVAETFRFRVL